MTASFIPVDQLEDGHTLVLGTTGSGKTYQLRGMLEQLRRADRRVGAVDKLGNHWGLTLGRDGTSPGLDFVIFGGKRAMVPMTPGQGADIARLFVTRNIPGIFDLSQWAADEQSEWLAAFAETVFRENDGALHLSIDEAQSFVPTGGAGGSDAARDAYRAVRLLAEQGRGNGLRLLLACQRLARLDSTVREMMHTVVAMRQTGTIDRKAVRELISADKSTAELIERELPKLPVGTGYVWSAGDVALRRITFGENTTFDSSRTPRHGDAPPAPIGVSSALVDELRAALAPLAAEESPAATGRDVSEANQIADLVRANAECANVISDQIERIAELEEQVADSLRDVSSLRVIITNARRWSDEARDAARRAYELLETGIALTAGDANPAGNGESTPKEPGTTDTTARPRVTPTPEGRADTADQAKGRQFAKARPDTELGAERKPLAVLAGFAPAGLTDASWATLSGFKRSGGTWSTYRSRLRVAGLIEKHGDLWRATPTGIEASGGDVERPPAPGRELVEFWAARIEGAGRMLRKLADLYPRALKRDALAAELGMAKTGGTFGTYLSRLRTNGLLEEKGASVRCAPALMGDAA